MKRISWSRRLRAFLLARAPRLFARWCTPDDRELGEWGEEIAARYLQRRGCRILGRRLETDLVEIDIVALERGSIVCVEVKTGRLEPLPRPRGNRDAVARAELRWRPGRRCDASRIARLRRAAKRLQREWNSSGARAARSIVSCVETDRSNRSGRNPSSPRDLGGAPSSRLGSRDGPSVQSAHVDLIEVILPMATRHPRVVHHPDVKRPPP